ncbi:hypothetical protein [Burkholderia vietnamiensis]|uniref:hypothetical protein n=1 Tax=Burkholderia vietnamiensis TaxID=60552 RepID=UPI001B9D53E2|nr:hypothetical protein [Burkholderia vietnamiensis]MBR8217002.1 hypothetical protein [Burkholderia vietnamiensis]MCA8226284.1 hypothetical protein [Burkholderia vietnamiensis]MDN7815435.1 hypothetical protein [Burkholderia vietnamiensis]
MVIDPFPTGMNAVRHRGRRCVARIESATGEIAAKGASGSQPTSTICKRSAEIDTISIAGLRIENAYPNSPVAALKWGSEPLPDND